jgi:hypothetical protein
MKVYGETIFDICYLLIALVVGIFILIKSKNKLGKLMGIATLVLGFGDAFHLVPRMLDYFINYDFTSYLGIGKLITSITMTIFYIFMYYIYKLNYEFDNKKIEYGIWILAIIRIILCLLPQNNWITNNGSITIGIIRNIPFVLIGLIIIILFFKNRKLDNIFKNIWLYVLLSFLFYIPVVIGASLVPALGMFMLPKTICYILIILSFRKKVIKE